MARSVLITTMIEEFCSRFSTGGQIIHTGKDDSVCAEEELRRLGVSLDERGKLPDLVIYLPDHNRLLLMQDASSRGPIDTQRRGELSGLFGGAFADLVFVSCFPSRADMRRFRDVAWETAVWCVDEPDHLIHFNGEGLVGPYEYDSS